MSSRAVSQAQPISIPGDEGRRLDTPFPLRSRLHGDACGIADLDPDAARAGLIGGIHLLGNDAVSAKLASMGEDGVGAIIHRAKPASECLFAINLHPHRTDA
jgi:hypothetical protein